jgi:hypothetical protein
MTAEVDDDSCRRELMTAADDIIPQFLKMLYSKFFKNTIILKRVTDTKVTGLTCEE